MKKTYIFCAAFCLLIASSSAVLLSWELRPFLSPKIENPANLELYASQGFKIGISSYSKEVVMKECLSTALGFSDVQLLYPSARGAVEKCFDRAGEIVSKTPSDSFAWFVKAVASARLFRDEPFNEALQLSQKMGANEQWIARERFALSEFYLSRVNSSTMAGHETDLALLASSYQGVKLIARRYVNNPEFRARITEIVEKRPPAEQRRFISNIKLAMREVAR